MIFPTRSWILLILFCGAIVVQSRGQVYQSVYRPPGVHYVTLESDHFSIIYQKGLSNDARRAAYILEHDLSTIQNLVGTSRQLHMPVVLNHFNDWSNGYVTPVPFKQEIESVAIKGHVLPPRSPSWYDTVLPHELVHAVHANSGSGFGVGSIVRLVSPDAGRSINFGAPGGLSEGIAVYMESTLREGEGRLNYSLFNMQFRAALTSRSPWSLVHMLEPPTYSRPFDRHYIGGGYLFRYVATQGKLDFFPRTRDFFYRMPFLGYGTAMWYGLGMLPHRFGRELQSALRAGEEERLEEQGPFTPVHTIVSSAGLYVRRPTWIDEKKILTYQSGYNRRPGFYSFDIRTEEQKLISNQRISEDYYYSLSDDKQTLYFSRYVQDRLVSIKALAEIFELDLTTGSVKQITRKARSLAPVLSSEKKMWVLENRGQYNRWSRLDDTFEPVPITQYDFSVFKALAPRPEGRDIAVLMNIKGHQGIFNASIDDTGRPVFRPRILFENASIYDMSWSRNGRFLLFTCDLGGVTNIYVLDYQSDRILKLTHVPYGALEPSLSPAGDTIAFVQYRHERFELATIPFKPDDAEEIPREWASYGDNIPWEQWLVRPEETDVLVTDPKPYRSIRYVKPRIFYPEIYYEQEETTGKNVKLGLGLGFGVEGTDPLQRWIYRGNIFRQTSRQWGSFYFETARSFLRPSVYLFRLPDVVNVRRTDADGEVQDIVRMGREERGIAMGIRTPVTLSSNVFRSRSLFKLSVEFHQDRLFDYQGTNITDYSGRISLRPSMRIALRVQSNIRDIVPNNGFLLSASSRTDVWAKAGTGKNRWVNIQGDLYLPYLRLWNAGLRITGGLHVQNRGGILDLDPFLPRGYENELVFLGRGAFLRYGMEYTQPLWYIDNGLILLPLYFKALYIFGFAEQLVSLDDQAETGRFTSMGSGLGLQFRFAHALDLDFKLGLSYLLDEHRWKIFFR